MANLALIALSVTASAWAVLASAEGETCSGKAVVEPLWDLFDQELAVAEVTFLQTKTDLTAVLLQAAEKEKQKVVESASAAAVAESEKQHSSDRVVESTATATATVAESERQKAAHVIESIASVAVKEKQTADEHVVKSNATAAQEGEQKASERVVESAAASESITNPDQQLKQQSNVVAVAESATEPEPKVDVIVATHAEAAPIHSLEERRLLEERVLHAARNGTASANMSKSSMISQWQAFLTQIATFKPKAPEAPHAHRRAGGNHKGGQTLGAVVGHGQ